MTRTTKVEKVEPDLRAGFRASRLLKARPEVGLHP